MTTVINLHGEPGCGKSTLAALIYAMMKMRGMGVELVREYIKSWAWEGRPVRGSDELYIFTKQERAESLLYGKVDWIITDRPLALSIVYDRLYRGNMESAYRKAMEEQQARYNVKYIDLMVKSKHPYVSAGRYHTEDEAREIAKICREVTPGMPMVSTTEQIFSIIGVNTEDPKWVCLKCGEDIELSNSVTLGGGGPFCLPCGEAVSEALENSSVFPTN